MLKKIIRERLSPQDKQKHFQLKKTKTRRLKIPNTDLRYTHLVYLLFCKKNTQINGRKL